MNTHLESHALDAESHVLTAAVENPALLTAGLFERLWGLRPSEPPRIRMYGRITPLPRRQQAFGRDYPFSGTVSQAAAIPDVLAPFLEWAQQAIEPRLNGLLVNWYDGAAGEYIGPHQDKTLHNSKEMLIPDCPLVTISLGAKRIFRLHRAKEKLRRDFPVENGAVVIIPFETNRRWEHSVPHRKTKDTGQRISVTLRAFTDAA